MSDEDYKNWLAALKPGDEVAVPVSRWAPAEIRKVSKLTPTQIVLDDGKRFDRLTGMVRRAGSYYSLRPYDDELRNAREHYDLSNWLTSLAHYRDSAAKIPLKVLRAMKTAFDEASK